jgi:hypothetical protein
MGLLDKTNPTATRASIIRHAVIWSVVSLVAFPFACMWGPPPFRDYWPILLPTFLIFGAAIGALMEWQLDDGVEIYWVVLEVEKEFDVKIPAADWQEIDTVADLFNATIRAINVRHPERFLGDSDYPTKIWGRLQALLVHLGLEPERVVKSASFYRDLGL